MSRWRYYRDLRRRYPTAPATALWRLAGTLHHRDKP